MKAKNLFFGALTCLAFAACSNDDEVIVNDNVQGEVNGEGYIALSISMPVAAQSRAQFGEDQDHLVDGLPKEYEVKNAMLLIFNTADILVEKLDLPTTFNSYADSPNHITNTSDKIIQEVSGTVQPGFGMLVVLNNNGQITDANAKEGTTLLSEILDLTTSVSGATHPFYSNDGGFFMTNAPLAKATSTNWENYFSPSNPGTPVSLLTKIGNVYTSRKAAENAATPDEVYVERAVAKVTMNSKATGKLNDDPSALQWTLNKWVLGNTNTVSYVVRNTTKSFMDDWAKLNSNSSSAQSGYRFIGATEVKTGAGLYRTYFAKDPNYNKNDGDGISTPDELQSAVVSNLSSEFGEENPQYCMENTFDVDHMLNINTTHVLLEAQIGDGTLDLYVVNKDKSHIYDDINDVHARIFNSLDLNILKSYLTGAESITSTDLTYEFENVEASDDLSLTSIALTNSGAYTNGADINAYLASQLVSINGKMTIAKYDGGLSYYAARIKHFDEYTPWKLNEDPIPGDGTGAYPAGGNRDGNYLGRYGVLRNNWYNLDVTKITTIGAATPETVIGEENDEDTDDELEQYVVMQINILSWAKRNQNVEL